MSDKDVVVPTVESSSLDKSHGINQDVTTKHSFESKFYNLNNINHDGITFNEIEAILSNAHEDDGSSSMSEAQMDIFNKGVQAILYRSMLKAAKRTFDSMAHEYHKTTPNQAPDGEDDKYHGEDKQEEARQDKLKKKKRRRRRGRDRRDKGDMNGSSADRRAIGMHHSPGGGVVRDPYYSNSIDRGGHYDGRYAPLPRGSDYDDGHYYYGRRSRSRSHSRDYRWRGRSRSCSRGPPASPGYYHDDYHHRHRRHHHEQRHGRSRSKSPIGFHSRNDFQERQGYNSSRRLSTTRGRGSMSPSRSISRSPPISPSDRRSSRRKRRRRRDSPHSSRSRSRSRSRGRRNYRRRSSRSRSPRRMRSRSRSRRSGSQRKRRHRSNRNPSISPLGSKDEHMSEKRRDGTHNVSNNDVQENNRSLKEDLIVNNAVYNDAPLAGHDERKSYHRDIERGVHKDDKQSNLSQRSRSRDGRKYRTRSNSRSVSVDPLRTKRRSRSLSLRRRIRSRSLSRDRNGYQRNDRENGRRRRARSRSLSKGSIGRRTRERNEKDTDG